VLAAPSGAGKTSLSRALLDDPALTLSISATTRAPRAGEVEGQHYFFMSQPAFDARVAEGAFFLEHAYVFGRSYGTPRAPVEAALAAGQDVLFDIDWQGFQQLRAALPGDVVGAYIRVPLPDLAARLAARGDAPAEIAKRMAQAEAELSHAGKFDFQVENADFDTALADLRAILRASRLATARHSVTKISY
jgi:guanylate kinase